MQRRRHDPIAKEGISSARAHDLNLIQPELIWRFPPPCGIMVSGQPMKIGISRWRLRSRGRTEVASDTDDDCHVLSIPLRKTSKELFVGGKSAWRGGAQGELLLTGPKRGRWTATIDGGCDFLRIFLSQSIIAECYAEVFGVLPQGNVSICDIMSVSDPRLRQLGQTFTALVGYDPVVGPCFADSLGLAFASRLVESAYGKEEFPGSHEIAPARISRVVDHIENHLGRTLHLSELSEAAGLSRVQFLRQFKKATGRSPHAYIVERRIERAKQLLKRPDSTLIGVALDLGFSNQSHFSQVFRKAVGIPPSQWRSSQA
jgi:AraC family transcriptional regulator